MAPETSPTRSRADARGSWLLPPLLLAATLTGVLLVLRGPDHIFGWALAALVGLAILWVLVSALSPASADRRCPRCGTDGLERLDPRTTEGLRCRGCGWSDASESSFLIAEDDGVPLEPIVLRGRETRREADRSGKSGGPAPGETEPR